MIKGAARSMPYGYGYSATSGGSGSLRYHRAARLHGSLGSIRYMEGPMLLLLGSVGALED
jgi:hypothetical protein